MIHKNTLFRIFEESKEKYTVELKPRLILENAIKYLNYKEALVLSGVRRSGKTSIMYALMQHLDITNPDASKVYINFEDERLAFLEPQDLDKILEYYYEFANPKTKVFFFLDEIQAVPLWEKWVSRSFEKFKFIISGSNSNLLSSELATALTGRHKEMRIYPFRFKEFLESKETTQKIEDVAYLSKNFDEYVKRGGFPESLLNQKTDLLPEYYRNILLKDVIGRHNIRHKSLMEKLSLFIMSNSGKSMSLYSLSKQYTAGINTIKNYIMYLESSFLCFSVNVFSFSIKKQQLNPSKIYAIDIGLAQSVAFEFSDNTGRKMESIVACDLSAQGKEIYYHKEKHECDFIIKEGQKIIIAIQVCSNLTTENKTREINGLLEACHIHKLKSGLLLTYDQSDEFEQDGVKITVQPIRRWLLR